MKAQITKAFVLSEPKHVQIEKRAYRIDEFCAAYGLGRTKVYELIKSGKLRTVLVDGRRLVPRDAGDALLSSSDLSYSI